MPTSSRGKGINRAVAPAPSLERKRSRITAGDCNNRHSSRDQAQSPAPLVGERGRHRVLRPGTLPGSRAAIALTARIMVGFPAGGPSDVRRRLPAEQMKSYASSTIVESRPGAGGRVVMDALKNSAADGSVMVLTPAVALAFTRTSPSRSATIRSRISPGDDHLHHVHADMTVPLVPTTVKQLAEFIVWCKSNPDQFLLRIAGRGFAPSIPRRPLSRGASFEYLHVPFREPASIQSPLSGQIPPASRRSGPSFRTVRAGTMGRWQSPAHSAVRCCPMCRPLPRRDTPRSHSRVVRHFRSGADVESDRRDVQQRPARGIANQGNAGWARRSSGRRRWHDAGRLCRQVRPHGPLGADREGPRFTRWISRTCRLRIAERTSTKNRPLPAIEQVGGDISYWHQADLPKFARSCPLREARAPATNAASMSVSDPS